MNKHGILAFYREHDGLAHTLITAILYGAISRRLADMLLIDREGFAPINW